MLWLGGAHVPPIIRQQIRLTLPALTNGRAPGHPRGPSQLLISATEPISECFLDLWASPAVLDPGSPWARRRGAILRD